MEEGKKEVPKEDFLRHFEKLEENISHIKSELGGFTKQGHKDSNSEIKKIIDGITEDYKEKIRERKIEAEENKKRVQDLIHEYESMIEGKNNYINELKRYIETQEKKLEPLADMGFPKEIITSSKEELAKLLVSFTEDNFNLQRNSQAIKNELKEKDTAYKNSMAALEKKFGSLSSQFGKVLEQKKAFETNFLDLKNRADVLEKQLSKTKELYEERIESLKQSQEDKIKDIIEEKTKSQVAMEASAGMLRQKLQDTKGRLAEKEMREKDFAQDVEKKLKEMMAPLISEVITNAGKREEKTKISDAASEASSIVEASLSKGDTKEKILEDLESKEHPKDEISKILEEKEKK